MNSNHRPAHFLQGPLSVKKAKLKPKDDKRGGASKMAPLPEGEILFAHCTHHVGKKLHSPLICNNLKWYTTVQYSTGDRSGLIQLWSGT